MAAVLDVTPKTGLLYGRICLAAHQHGANGDGRVAIRITSSTRAELLRERDEVEDGGRALAGKPEWR